MADKKTPTPTTETITTTRAGRPVAIEDLRSKVTADKTRGKK